MLLSRHDFDTDLTATQVADGLAVGAITGTRVARNTALAYTSSPVLQATGSTSRPVGHRADSDSFSFTITPAPGATVDLTSLAFSVARGGAGTRGFEVTSSVDGFVSALLSVGTVATQRPTWTSYSADLTSLPATSGPITLRVYFHTNSGTATLEFDGFQLDGDLTVPAGATGAGAGATAPVAGAGAATVTQTTGPSNVVVTTQPAGTATGGGSGTLAPAAGSGIAAARSAGSGAGTAPPATATGAATARATGTGAGGVGPVTGTGAAAVTTPASGTGAALVPPVTGTGTGGSAAVGQGQGQGAAATGAGSSGSSASGQGDGSTGTPDVQGSSTSAALGQGAGALDPVTGQGEGEARPAYLDVDPPTSRTVVRAGRARAFTDRGRTRETVGEPRTRTLQRSP